MTCKLEITTFKMENRRVEGTDYYGGQWVYESQKIIDHDNPSDRKWFGSHCFWAARNGRQVTSTPTGCSNDSLIEMGRKSR